MTVLPKPNYNREIKQERIFFDKAIGEKGIRASDCRWNWLGKSIKYKGEDNKEHYLNRTSARKFLKRHHIDVKNLSNNDILIKISEISKSSLFGAISYNEPSQNALVKKFATDITGMPGNSLSIKKVEPGLTTGVSGTPVFLISNVKTHELLLVVKITDRESASKEAMALSFLNKLGIKEANFPHVLKIGTIEGTPKILIAQSAASGKPLEHFMTSVGKLEGQDRAIKFKGLGKIMESSAHALASFHNHKPKKYDDSDIKERSDILIKYKSEFTSYIKAIDNLKTRNRSLEGINSNELLKMVQKVKFSPVGEYVHDDYHLGNVFYNEKGSPPITVIDNDGVLNSVSSKTKAPIGIGAHDVVYFIQWIAIQGQISRLQPEEIQELQNDFLKAYLDSRKDIDEKFISELDFMKIYIPVKYICNLQVALETPSHPWNQSLGSENLQGFIEHLANHLSNQLIY